MQYDSRKPRPSHDIPATTKVYIVCPVCQNDQVELAGLEPHQSLLRHYMPGTKEVCTNHGREYRESV